MSSSSFTCLAALGLLLAASNARADGPPPMPLPGSGPAPAAAPPGYPAPGAYAPQPGYPYAASAPPGWYPPPASYFPYTPMKRRSSGMIAGGVILVSLSSIGLIAGSAMISGADNGTWVCTTDFGSCGRQSDSTLKGAGIATVVIGLVALGVGIPLTVVGAQKVPDKDDARSLLPTVRVGSGGSSVAWEF